MSSVSLFVCMAMMLLSLSTRAADSAPQLIFSHSDWELACDNTRTCRAAGYQSDSDELTVSVLLTRKAGARQPVSGQLMIGNYGENKALSQLPSVFKLTMRINGRSLGQVMIRQDMLVTELSKRQVAALLLALLRDSKIEWGIGKHSWHLSDKGAAAVLLKMDEFQGRVDTKGALVKKGSLGEDTVFPPLPVPVIIVPLLSLTNNHLEINQLKVLREAIRTTIKEDDYNNDCPVLSAGSGEEELSVYRLTETKLLVSTLCSFGYNLGYGYWVINDTPDYQPSLVTTSGSFVSTRGTISASHKGRGLGDCWSGDEWHWDGNQFIHTQSSASGMCKLLAPGGAWELPTLITEIRW